MKKILILVSSFIILLVLSGVVYWHYNSVPVKDIKPSVVAENSTSGVPTQNPMPGSDRDAHGCIGSAGYSWCAAKNACIRPWEEYCTTSTAKTAVFNCDKSKKITATFYPDDDKYVDLVLSDERALSVPHAISASGARYAKPDESFVFWNKGNTAFITEGSTTTFSNCVTKD